MDKDYYMHDTADDVRGGMGMTTPPTGIVSIDPPAADQAVPYFPPYPLADTALLTPPEMIADQARFAETLHQSKENPITIKPIKTPEIMTALRLRHKTSFGHLHVSIALDVKADREYEIFAQLGKAGEMTASDLEGMCRLASLYLRAGGELKDITKQLLGIGSTFSSSHEEKVSIANSLGEALARYTEFKKKFGLQALLLGEIEISEE